MNLQRTEQEVEVGVKVEQIVHGDRQLQVHVWTS